jgi:hypothetical protein
MVYTGLPRFTSVCPPMDKAWRPWIMGTLVAPATEVRLGRMRNRQNYADSGVIRHGTARSAKSLNYGVATRPQAAHHIARRSRG